MATHATATFTVTSWDERPYDEIGGGAKLTRATVTQSYDGDIEGTGTVEYLMAYRDDGSATFAGLQRVVGRVGGRSGSFVLQIDGAFDGGTARGAWFVVAGFDGLRGLTGRGGFTAQHGPNGSATLDYEFE